MIAIVTDSTVCMTKREAALYGVRIVPQNYIVDGKTYKEAYADSFGDTVSLIENRSAASDTRQPEVSDFLEAFSLLVRKGYEILCLTLSSKLSGAYYNAVLAKKKLGGGRVEVIDSSLTAGGMYLLVKRARYLAASGMTLEEIAGGVYKYIPFIYTRFSVDDFAFLRSGHRLGAVRKSVGTVPGRKPLLKLHGGSITAEDTALGSGDRIRRMLRSIPHSATNIIIHYIVPSQRMETVFRLARRLFPYASVERRQLGPVLGIHLGCSVIGIVWSLR